jgi:hypothetical protein
MTSEGMAILRTLHEIVQSFGDVPELKKYRTRNTRPLNPAVIGQTLIHVKDERVRHKGFDAIRCFYDVARREMFSTTDLEPIEHISTSVDRRLRELGVQLLLLLAMHHVAARESLFLLLNASNYSIRLTTITFFEAFCSVFPSQFFLRVLAKALGDASAKVRTFAAVAVHSYFVRNPQREGRMESLSLLIDRLKGETDPKVTYNLLFSILRIGDAYELRDSPNKKTGLYHKKKKTENASLIFEVHLGREYVDSLMPAKHPG